MKVNMRLAVWVAVIAILVGYGICKMLHRQAMRQPEAKTHVADTVRQIGFNIHRLLLRFS